MPKTIISLELNMEHAAKIDELQAQCGLATKEEMWSTALTVYRWMVTEERAGRVIASIDPANSTYREFKIIPPSPDPGKDR
jgi:hypothetical protein